MKITSVVNKKDDNNNEIVFVGNAEMKRAEIIFKEKNSTVVIGHDCILRDARIYVGKNSNVNIGDQSTIDGEIFVGAYSSVKIGKSLSVTHNLKIRAVESTSVEIGDDCLLASNTSIRTNDGHPLYSTITHERINQSKDIKIGDHVWIGDEAKIYKGVNIGDASIIGACSIVTKDVERNTLVAGIPAKVIKKNITWEHSTGLKTEKYYDNKKIVSVQSAHERTKKISKVEHALGEEFIIRGVDLAVPNNLLTPAIRKSIENGTYEGMEARQLPRYIKEGERLLEFGAGLGFISAYCASLVNLESCVVVEANPKLIPVIAENHRRNDVKSHVINAVALSDDAELWQKVDQNGEIPFYVTENFWGASLVAQENAIEVTSVPAISVEQLIAEYQPTLIVCDIEGGEIDLLDRADLSSVRHISFEVHKSVIGLKGISKIIDVLRRSGLFYDPDFSMGQVIVFSRG
ncbi:FkbM family methyltransferase [Roseibium aggregatum]|uniref:Galactoside O-acetyltransferase n=1 Tax=Roseibium aggregatum TaxID=187304 RepID=A0A0M6Y7K5_9HYPH|nr:FkbM family methyltransferase [Roseibium aggregatum]CTQ45379.1 Galactoside O-acetyltransferase [Roseibium aggregatum]